MSRPWTFACALALLLSPSFACTPAPETPDKARVERPSLPALADQLARDAPAPRSLFERLPEAVRQEIKAHVKADGPEDKRFDEASARLSRYNVRLGEPATSVPFVEGLYLAESLALKPGPQQLRAAALLVTTYEAAAIIFPTMVETSRMFSQVTDNPSSHNDPFFPLWQAIVSDGLKQQAAFAALVLRGSPPDEVAIQVMRSVARSQPREPRARVELRRLLQQEVVTREDKGATVDEWLDLAETHLLLEDADRAQQAIERSKQSTVVKTLTGAERETALTNATARRDRLIEEQARLREIRALDRATSPEQRLQRASLLLANNNIPAARDAYEQLRRDLPNDARPVVGLARANMSKSNTPVFELFFAAKDSLQAAAGYDNKDGNYYGLMIGLLGFELGRFMREAATDEAKFKARAVTLLDNLESLNRENTRFSEDRAAILGFILKSIRQEMGREFNSDGLKERLSAYCTEGVALAARYPNTSDAFRLSLGCAALIEPQRAFEVALTPLPTSLSKDTALAELRARVLVGLVARHSAFERLDAVRAVVEALPATNDAQRTARTVLQADLLAVAAAGKKASWSDAASAYQKARDLVPASENSRLSNNLAVALTATGKPLDQEGIDRYKQAIAIAKNDRERIARANLAAIAILLKSYSEALDLLQPLLQESDPHVAARLHAIGADINLGKLASAREHAKAVLAELKKDKEDPAKYGAFGPSVFVWSPGSMNFGLNVRSHEATYGMEIGSVYEVYLMLPAGITYPDFTRLTEPPPEPPKDDPKAKKPAPKGPPKPAPKKK